MSQKLVIFVSLFLVILPVVFVSKIRYYNIINQSIILRKKKESAIHDITRFYRDGS